jgi:hypothetical protein
MSATEYQAQVRKLWVAYDRMPRADALDAAYEAWLPPLIRFPVHVVSATIDEAIRADERMPNVGIIVRRCSATVRANQRRDDEPVSAEYPVKRMDVVGVLRAMRKVAEDPTRKRLEHDHRHGAEQCPICGTHDRDDEGMHAKDCAWCTRLAEASIGVVEDFIGRPLTDADRLSRCARCDGYGWRYTDDDRVRPCGNCQPEQYRRWHEGHWEPGHHCDECQRIREGRYKADA